MVWTYCLGDIQLMVMSAKAWHADGIEERHVEKVIKGEGGH